jgi:tRNA/tmRNA/rRNA uracil-C5-methylase (TrmA/RlmC/RlmD family)
VKFRRGDAAREIGGLRDFDLVLVDPPRLGLPKPLLAGLVRLRPAEIVFVSCDPPTFSRDAASLIEAGYLLSGLNLVDLFPATYHAEIVAIFRRG